jgi:hypothetical protein
MPDSQEFKLLIEGDASSFVDAAQASTDATQRLKGATTDLGDQSKQAASNLGEHSDATKKLGEEIGKTGEKSESGGREIRRLANDLGNMIGVSDLGALSMGKMGVAAFGVGAALEFLFKTYEDIQEAIKGPIDIEVKDDSAAITSNAKAWNEYAEARRKVAEGANSPEAMEQREVSALEKKYSLLQKILAIEEQEALAALATKQGQMSPEAYLAAQESIKASYGAKGSAASDAEKQAQIEAMKREQARLEAEAEAKRKEAAAVPTGNASAEGAAKENAESAKKALKEIEDAIALIKRLENPNIAEYSGLGGAVQKEEDFWMFFKRYGYTFDGTDPMKREQTRKGQAEAEIATGAYVEENADERNKRRSELETQAGTAQGQADILKEAIKQAMAEMDAERTATVVTQAVQAAITAMAREHAAEGNNTSTGTRDAISAQKSAAAATAQVMAALQDMGNSDSEQKAALLKTLNDITAENRALAAKIRNMPGGNK